MESDCTNFVKSYFAWLTLQVCLQMAQHWQVLEHYRCWWPTVKWYEENLKTASEEDWDLLKKRKCDITCW